MRRLPHSLLDKGYDWISKSTNDTGLIHEFGVFKIYDKLLVNIVYSENFLVLSVFHGRWYPVLENTSMGRIDATLYQCHRFFYLSYF